MAAEEDGRKLYGMGTVHKSSIGDVCVCKSIEGTHPVYYTVWKMKNRAVLKKILEEMSCTCITREGAVCFLFPYEEPREIKRYCQSTIGAHAVLGEQILRNCLECCMTCRISYSILYLILKQGQVNVRKDGTVYFGYLLDLEEFQPGITQGQCVEECARLLLQLFPRTVAQSAFPFCRIFRRLPQAFEEGRQLLEQKLERGVYTDFMELFWDIQMMTKVKHKTSRRERLKDKIMVQKDHIFGILLRLCILLLSVVAVMFVVNIVWGTDSFSRLLGPSIKEIGTESLLQ